MVLSPIIKRFGCGAAASLLAFACAMAASPSAVRPTGFDTRFGPRQLGGVTRIVRYLVPQPDREQTAYLFLAGEGTATSPPQEVQVIGKGGELLHLSDTQGADCALEHVRVYALPGGGAEIIYANRGFSGRLGAFANSDPAPMEVSVFRAGPARDPGDSDVVFRLAGAPRWSRPVCGLNDVESEMSRVSAMVEQRR